MTVPRPRFVADFETTTDIEDCRVWAYGFCEVGPDPRVSMGNSLDDFMEIFSKSDSDVYFHNLKFDGRFILDWLFRHGYEFTQDKTVQSGKFSTLISSMGSFYQISVTFLNGFNVTFKDSYKKLPMAVSEVARAFNLDIGKGELDYDALRPVGHILTDEEKEYIRRDVSIVAQALHKQFQAGMTRLTVTADSMADFKKIVGSSYFKKMYPVLPETMDAQIRLAYRGGFTYAAERFQGQRVGPGSVYDVNSLYPHVMRNKELPYGLPLYFPDVPTDDPAYPLFIVSVTFTAKLKKNHIPCVQVKRNLFYNSRQYQSIISEPVTLVCTSVDLDLWQRHYDMKIISWNGGYQFKSTVGEFTDYVDKWARVKAEHEGGLRTIAKLHLNSLYGKFATNPDVTPKIPYFEDDIVKLRMGEEEKRDPVYTPVGCFITAHARDLTISAAQDNYETFAYADTDSLHLLTQEPPKSIAVHRTNLGEWKHEYNFSEAIFMRAKQYIEIKDDGEHEAHFAGMPERVAATLTLDDMTPGREIGGVLKARAVPGGIVLTETTFTL